MPSPRRTPPTPPASGNRARVAVAGGAVLVVLLAWALWPSRYDGVRNLDSRGTGVIAFGDSLTAGYGAAPGEDYPTVLARAAGVPVANAGVSGDTTEAALARLESDVLATDPRIVIVGLGGNDFLRGVPLATTEANLRDIVRRTQARGAMVVMLGFRFPSLSANYDSMYERIADEEGALLIPDLLDGILSDSSLKSDDIHPNGRGYALMAERIGGPFAALRRRADAAR